MKKYILILFAAASLVWSCNELDNDSRLGSMTAPGALSNVETSARIGSVVFTWDNPTSGDYYYTLVEFQRGGETVKHKISRYAVSPTKGEGHTRYIYEGFEDTNTYTFTLTPYSADGQAGPSQTVTGAAEDASYAYKYVAETVTIEPEVEGAQVSWINEYHRDVTVNISYEDVAGQVVTKKVTSSADGKVSIGAFTKTTSVTVTSANAAGQTSEPTVVSVTPKTGEIPVSRMAIDEYSDFWQSGYELKNVLDRNMNSYWHTALTGPYHWFIVDLGYVHMVNAIEVIRRQTDAGYGSPLKALKLSVSVDDENFTTVYDGEYDAGPVYANHMFIFDEQLARYIKVEVTSEGSWAHVAEFLAYYSPDPKSASPYADEASAELAPDPDDDPTVYEDVEYLYPDNFGQAGWVNNLKYYQADDRSNDTEWTFETTGGDSWMPLGRLKNDAAGPMLVFQYKCTKSITLEFFWCNEKGFGDGGPAGGRSTAFSISKSDEWKTFKRDFSNDWKTHKWSGKAGCTVRFDVGDGAGVTLVVRNMRWQPVPQ
ncbi:MAG: discoidin domain-containing protein [Bacteroidales bacterium]|nr:discoidin domain-containing protein [Bacteroidales bacterium]